MKYLLPILVIALASNNVFAKTIQGKVMASDNNETIIGASIFVPVAELKKIGSDKVNVSTVTDLDGNFSLEVPDKTKSIECSYVGYSTQSVPLKDNISNMVITLKSSAQLDEVVVTGYQKIEKRKLTAAISTVNVNDNMLGDVMSVDQALAGQVAGLSSVATSGAPGAPAKIRIRGTASLNGTQDPLWVLDGIPMEGTSLPSMEDLKDIDELYSSSVAGINPADIETITVLKDAAATAIYGARAANGVILITTKSGKVGKTKITFSTRLSFSPKTDIDRLNLLNSSQKVDLELDLLKSGYTYRENKGDVSRIIASAGLTDSYKANGWNALTSDVQGRINNLRSINTDWNDILFRSTFNQEYNLSLSGGNDKATYYTSLGYNDEKGNVVGVEANRFNLVAKTSYRLSRRFKVGASLFANRRVNKSNLTDADGFTNPVYYSRRANPYQTPFNADGSYNYDTDIQGKEDSDLKFNIFEERDGTSYELETKSLQAILDAEFRINDQIKATTQLGIQLDDTNKEMVADHDTYAMRKDKERTTLAVLNNTSFLPDGGKCTNAASTNSQITWKLQGEYSNKFADIHELEGMVGTEIRKTWYKASTATLYGYNRKTLQSVAPIFPSDTWAKQYPLSTKSYSENAYASFFATASYTLLHRYTLGGSVRFDGSDIFGVDKKYRFLPLYSVSGLWRLSDEPFMNEVEKINNLAFRLSYGIQGNIDKSTSSQVTGYYQNITMLPGYTEDMIVVGTAPNTKLRWEKTKTFTAGADMSIFNNAISLSLDYYNRDGSDLIAIRMLPLESGFSSMYVNWASMKNDGFEVSINTRNIHTKDFMWFTNFNFAYNNNKVLKESVPENQTTPGREGYPVGAIFAYKSAGLDDEGYPLFYNKAGEKVNAQELLKLNSYGGSTLTAAEQRDLYTYIGSSDPLFTGGLMNTFTYRNFELSLNFIFNLKMYVKTTPSYSPTNFDRGLNSNADILNRWTSTNTNTLFPVLMQSGYRQAEYARYSEFGLYEQLDTWVKRGDHVRLQNVRFAYRLPSEWVKKASMESVTVALEARNLFVFGANYNNYLDPETMGNQFAQPIPKTFTFSLNVNF
ncbi:MAG: SusC/RagA family TonB-linked outer membrane protein [Muribaculaceae bacterium]|nr:SusC/RagA family TonB-linked outer membrane protein [Muribaculaceae bacterium]